MCEVTIEVCVDKIGLYEYRREVGEDTMGACEDTIGVCENTIEICENTIGVC